MKITATKIFSFFFCRDSESEKKEAPLYAKILLIQLLLYGKLTGGAKAQLILGIWQRDPLVPRKRVGQTGDFGTSPSPDHKVQVGISEIWI